MQILENKDRWSSDFREGWLAHLEQTSGWARSLSLDLYDQWQGLERNGQFRFTPPTHALLAFYQALLELEQEGGVAARAARYRNNHETLIAGMFIGIGVATGLVIGLGLSLH